VSVIIITWAMVVGLSLAVIFSFLSGTALSVLYWFLSEYEDERE